MAKKKIVKDKDGKQVEIDQDAINAALASAVTMADGSHPVEEKPTENNNKDNAARVEENLEESGGIEGGKPNTGQDVDDEPGKNPCCSEGSNGTSSNLDFAKACYDMTITAKQCNQQSSMFEDKSIVDYIRSINQKIYGETRKGSYSTNVQFRVTPQDWVNVNHIFDWYRSRGFQVEVKETTTAPYGKEVGTINYNFTISWVEV